MSKKRISEGNDSAQKKVFEEVEEESSSDDLEEVIIDSNESNEEEEIIKATWTGDRKIASDEELVCADGTYTIYHSINTPWRCLSFDFVRLPGVTEYPMEIYALGGTQADAGNKNELMVMKWSNIHRTLNDGLESDDMIDNIYEGGEAMIDMRAIPIPFGSINKVAACPQLARLCATFSEDGVVRVWDIKSHLDSICDNKGDELLQKPISDIKHISEGFALEFNPQKAGTFASGCRGGMLQIAAPKSVLNYTTLSSIYMPENQDIECLSHSCHTDGGEVLYTGVVGGNMYRYDGRNGQLDCVVKKAHEGDINTIACNIHASCPTLIATGGDDNVARVWDSRNFSFGAVLKAQRDAICSIAWSYSEPSVLATASYDDSVLLWDLSVEKADEPDVIAVAEKSGAGQYPDEVLFDHRGDKDISAVKYHHQIVDLLVTSSSTGFRLFRPRL